MVIISVGIVLFFRQLNNKLTQPLDQKIDNPLWNTRVEMILERLIRIITRVNVWIKNEPKLVIVFNLWFSSVFLFYFFFDIKTILYYNITI